MMDAIIVEDQVSIREGLKKMLSIYVPEVKVIGEAGSVSSGVELIRSLKADILFLDIEMQDGNAFQLVDSLSAPVPEIVFVTAHDKYALEALKLSAVDYLLKPIAKEDLQLAVEKARQRIVENRTDRLQVLVENLTSTNKKIVLRDADNIHVLVVSEIIRCEAEGGYTVFLTKEGRKITISKTLKEYDQLLSSYGFLRVHHSHLVNLHEIKRFNKTTEHQIILSNGEKLPVSFRKKDQLIQRLTTLGI